MLWLLFLLCFFILVCTLDAHSSILLPSFSKAAGTQSASHEFFLALTVAQCMQIHTTLSRVNAVASTTLNYKVTLQFRGLLRRMIAAGQVIVPLCMSSLCVVERVTQPESSLVWNGFKEAVNLLLKRLDWFRGLFKQYWFGNITSKQKCKIHFATLLFDPVLFFHDLALQATSSTLVWRPTLCFGRRGRNGAHQQPAALPPKTNIKHQHLLKQEPDDFNAVEAVKAEAESKHQASQTQLTSRMLGKGRGVARPVWTFFWCWEKVVNLLEQKFDEISSRQH